MHISILAALLAVAGVSSAFRIDVPSSDHSCDAGYQYVNNACAECPAGSYSRGGTDKCVECPDNHYSSSSGASFCARCPYDQTSAKGSSQCTSLNCPAGTHAEENKCTGCPRNTFSTQATAGTSDTRAASCTPCPAGHKSDKGSSKCTAACPAGKIYEDDACHTCQAGTYASDNVCKECAPGSVSNAGSTSCTACPAGSIPASNGKSCNTCPPNTYSDGDSCSSCSAGKGSTAGSSSCTSPSSARAVVARQEPSPQPSPHSFTIRQPSCSQPGYQLCPVFNGVGGTECVDTRSTLDSCGGCVAPEGVSDDEHTGRDCTTIPHAGDVSCDQGKCVVLTCAIGFKPSGEGCMPSRRRSQKFFIN